MQADYIASPADRILITGSNGFIGARVVAILLEYGFRNLRCFVRPSSNLDRLNKVLKHFDAVDDVELITGDLLIRDDCRRASDGASIIFHLAAGIQKSFAGAFMSSALATRNLLDAFLEHGQPRRFVNVSSFAVYSNLKLRRGALLDESCALEESFQERCEPYGFGKFKQEQLVIEYGKNRRLPYVILRPGTVFGPGNRSLSRRVGVDMFGLFLHMGGTNVLPLSFVDNCAEAIVLGGLKPGVDGEVFNVVDNDPLTSRQFLKAYRSVAGSSRSVWMPYPFARALCVLWETYSRWSKGQLPPVFNRRRCSAEWKGNRYSNQKLCQRLGWKPRVSMEQAMASFLDQFHSPSN